MTGAAHVLRGTALALPLADESVDLIVTSPPYFGLRSYQDGGEHYAGQIGDEATPAEFVDSLIAATREMMRVVKPAGSIWVNLGDKYAAAERGPDGSSSGLSNGAQFRVGRGRKPADCGVPRKSLIGIPWRYALRCVDDLGLILRAEQIWSKPNGLPESVTDRTRRSHEQWFHFTKEPHYFSAVDEIREPHIQKANGAVFGGKKAVDAGGIVGASERRTGMNTYDALNPLGKLPGSVWEISTQPLVVPEHIAHADCCGGQMRPGCEDGLDHYAAFPMEWPRRIIRGWAPTQGVCTACGEGRAPATDSSRVPDRPGRVQGRTVDALLDGHGPDGRAGNRYTSVSAITGYTCACPAPTAPTTRAVVLDPFGGTGTTALVAKVLGCDGFSVDMSADYCRLAEWRTNDPDEIARAMQAKKPAKQVDGQVSMFDLFADGAA